MAKDNKFSISDIEAKGYILNKETGQYERPKSEIYSPFMKQQLNMELEPKEDIIEVPNVELDIKTEWFVNNYSVPAKKNSKQIIPKKGGGFFLIPSKSHAEYKKMTAMQYQMYSIEFRRAVKFYALEYPLRVEFTFIRPTKHRCDFTNLCDTVQDIMVEHDFLPDDDMLHLIPSFQPRQDNKKDFGVIIRLITK